MRFIIRILANSLGVYLSVYLINNVNFGGSWRSLLICGLVLALLNAIVRPILKLISLPLIFITFGAFTILINIFVIWLLTKFITPLSITGLWAFLATSLIISFTNFIVNFLTKNNKKNKNNHAQ